MPQESQRRGLPISFLRSTPSSTLSPSSPPAPSSPRDDTDQRDLAIAVDGSFVETTSEVAARSMAKFYSAQEGEGGIKVGYAIQKRTDKDGRTLYRIRPLSHSSTSPDRFAHTSTDLSSSPSSSLQSDGHIPFARPSNQPPPPKSSPTIALHRSSAQMPPSQLRSTRSIPLLQTGNTTETASDRDLGEGAKADLNAGLLHPDSIATSPDRPLRRAGSTPLLTNPTKAHHSTLRSSQSAHPSPLSLFDATIRKPRHSTEGDVLGRILGWREEVGERKAGSDRRKGRKMDSTARVPLSEVFAVVSATSEREKRGTNETLESRDSDTSDLPEDFEELASSVTQDRSEGFLVRPYFSRSTSTSSPFGSGVRLPRTNPSLAPPQVHSAPPIAIQERTMREVSSNDSIRTARADDPHTQPTTPRMNFSLPSNRPPRFEDPQVFDVFHAQPPPTSPPILSTAPLGQHSRFPSTSSLASSASGHSRTTAQQITVHSAPGDDPRFVIWGYKESSSTPANVPSAITSSRRPSLIQPISPPLASEPRRMSMAEQDHQSSPGSSAAGSPATASSRRWSLSARGGGGRDSGSGYASPATSVRDSVGSNPSNSSQSQRILMAATVERLIAELTSQISVELLSDFFLTYRHYLSPLDLLHLLLTRFDWAMYPSSTSEDDALRRVVRVRTFVVLRYWLLNHFMDDFYPSKEMRTGLTEWLNASARDPRFRESQKDARLIKNLKKTVRKCKETFVVGRQGGSSMQTEITGRRTSEEDVDLEMVDFALRSSRSPPPTSTSFKFGTFRSRKNSAASPLPPSSYTSSSEPAFPLPGTSQNPIARSFSSALGSFGRFKRMLGHRASNAGGNDEGGNDVEFEQSETGDLLWVKGGLEKYLEYWDIKRESEEDQFEGSGIAEPVVEEEPLIEEERVEGNSDSKDATTPTMPQVDSNIVIESLLVPPVSSTDKLGLGILTPPPSRSSQPSPLPGPSSTDYIFPPSKKKATPPPPLLPIFDPETYSTLNYSTSSSPFGRPASARIVLDDLDDSDDDDEDVVEVKRTLKRLPNAHNLRLVAATGPPTPGSFRSSLESETSYGFGNGPRLSYGGQERESVLFVDDEEGGEVGVTVIPNFILEGLLDSEDEDEPGDVEAALRRLEGLVDSSKEQEKAKKVERQMERSEKLDLDRKKQEAGIESSSASVTSSKHSSLASHTEEQEEEEEERGSVAPIAVESEDSSTNPREAAVVAVESTVILPPDTFETITPFSSQTSEPVKSPSVSPEPAVLKSPPRPARAPSRLGVPPAYPTSEGRKATLSRIFGTSPSQSRPVSSKPSGLANSAPSPPVHRSFLLFCRTETLAQQFTLIERDMLRMLSYQELVSGSWRTRMGETDVLDWEIYLKDRRREDLVAKEKGEQVMSAVQDVITRFNLMANWVCSEILLTANSDERAILIGKFIRLAFKCYCHSNFQTVMQIVHGLQIPHVERLKKTWAKVPSWEIRKLEGMQRFISHLKNFTHLRDLMNRLAAEYSPGGERTSLSDPIYSLALKGCIPFTGLFLRDLALNAELPTFLDPTSTNSPASVDASGALTSVADVDAFATLTPLPEGFTLCPLVNLHKFRRLATIVQRIRTFQALSERYTFEPVQSVYFKCLKIRSLDQTVMSSLSSRIEP